MSSTLFFSIYTLTATLSLPGAAVLTLAGGAVFGFSLGFILVSFASSLGATLAFLLSRSLLQDWVEKQFGAKISTFQEGVKKDGAFYLFAVRLVPAFPFFLVNLVMGLTPIKLKTFYWVSQIGMLPATAVYVNAGTQLAKIESLTGILSLELIAAFAALAILPFLSGWSLSQIRLRQLYSKFKKPKKFNYNLVVIGGGSAGLVTAYIAAALKAKVALIEKHKMGGDCLNTGCVPSKALIKSAKMAHVTKNLSKFGLSGDPAKVDFAQVMERVSQIIKKIEPHDSIERYESLGVNCYQGHAKVLSPYTVQVDDLCLTTKNIVIATGARPLVPNIPGLAEVPHFTSDTIWSLRRQPERLIVLGGGPIGCELAQAFSRLGSKVVLVEMAHL